MKKLGVIGGLGPMATALFMQMVIEMTLAEKDQDHIEMVVYNSPGIPDRTGYILGKSAEDPAPEMIRLGRKLAAEGADLIAVPCITATCFYDRLAEAVPVRIIQIVEETCRYLRERKIQSVGLMATSGTIESRLFQRAFEQSGCRLLLPSEQRQQDVMHVIYNNVKANKSVDMHRFFAVVQELRDQGAEVIVLGCTELSVVHRDYDIGGGFLDAMQLMAKCAAESCGTLREEYRELISE